MIRRLFPSLFDPAIHYLFLTALLVCLSVITRIADANGWIAGGVIGK